MLQANGMPLAVASGSHEEIIEMVVGHLGAGHCFELLVSSRELEHGKPFPDIYLETARRLRVAPEYCLAIEDAAIGVAAAKAAGMKVIAVPNRFTAQDDFSQADIVVKSLEDITWEVISSL
jgi:HAD superfamily hydrolase (TIGR01509 family)